MNQIEEKDLGFSTAAITQHQRLIKADGSSSVISKGLPLLRFYDLYKWLITMSWARFNVMVTFGFLMVNIFFAAVYTLLGPHALNGVEGNITERYIGSFFFSAQTVSTVGYGHISPNGVAASAVAAVESLLGLMIFALATGLLYGRFSRATAKIKYSKNILVAPYKDGKALMFRFANMRSNQVIDCEIQIIYSRNETENGKTARRFYTLELERKYVSMLTLTWTVVHPLGEESPLYDLTQAQLTSENAEILVMFKGFDDTFAQTVHSRTSYLYDEFLFDHKFLPAFHVNEQGVNEMDFDKIDDTQAVN